MSLNPNPSSDPVLPLPTRVIVSLRAGAVLAIANIICVVILAWAYISARTEAKVISVTGSAKKTIESDLIVWRVHVSVNNPDLVAGYDALNVSMAKVQAFLAKANVSANEIQISSITTTKNRTRDEKGNFTDKITSYDLVQHVEVSSTSVKRISDLAREVTSLIKEGMFLESDSPQYFYTKLADLKIEMLAEATKDATARANQIATNSNATLGPIRDARMGVMQINPVNSNSVSDSGNNDTTSLVKEITGIVSAKFELK
jgi:uncharacterized protein